MKIKEIFIFISLLFIFGINNVNAVSSKNVCNIGSTDGLLYPNTWSFKVNFECGLGTVTGGNGSDLKCVQKGVGPSGVIGDGFRIEVTHSHLKYCPTQGCTGDEYSTSFSVNRLNDLFTTNNYYNVFGTSSNGVSGVYTDSSLKSMLKRGNCPKYVYVASSKTKGKIAFIFASQKIDNAQELFENAGYTVSFEKQDGGENLTNIAKENYEKQVQTMKNNIQEFKDNDWGNIYNEECSKFSKFGGIIWGENIVIEYYDKYKEDLLSVNRDYDFSNGEAVLAEYKTMNCAPKPDPEAELPEIESGRVTCATIFKDSTGNYNNTWKLLNTSLKFIQYLGIILALVLSILDFIKVVPTQDKDALKKSTSKAVTRLVIAILIFFVPLILNFVLSLIGFNDPTCGLF